MSASLRSRDGVARLVKRDKVVRRCLGCQRSFVASRRLRGRYCSRRCYYDRLRANWAERQCPTCDKVFYDTSSRRGVYCSIDCYTRRRVNVVQKQCEGCGAPFETIPCQLRRGKGRFCSKRCSRRAQPSPVPPIDRLRRNCLECRAVFFAKQCDVARGKGVFCGRTCRSIFTNRVIAHIWPRDPRAKTARAAVARAVRDGRLIRPFVCSACGRDGRIEGHHEDYAQPLQVDWLCNGCHQKRHRLVAAARSASRAASSSAVMS